MGFSNSVSGWFFCLGDFFRNLVGFCLGLFLFAQVGGCLFCDYVCCFQFYGLDELVVIVC